MDALSNVSHADLSCLCGLRLIETGSQFAVSLVHQIGVIARNDVVVRSSSS